MTDFSIDQNKLPGVKEVCRDFAVLEDHSLAHNLQEQEIENHLASNIHKNRLARQDRQVARRLQAEEDLNAKARAQQRHQHLEQSDGEVAQEIQQQLVWQAKQQQRQEEKDEAIARRLQKKEQKEEEKMKKKKKQRDVTLEEGYHGAPYGGGSDVQVQLDTWESTQGIARLDLRDQEVIDMEVARMLQEEELRGSRLDKKAAQVAQDEEIAYLLMMDDERKQKKAHKKTKDQDRGRAGVVWRMDPEEVRRPRSRGDSDNPRPRSEKPPRPPPPSLLNRNVDSRSLPPVLPDSPQSSVRHGGTLQGSLYRQ